ncbi:undecaprenyl-diphosphate phosphatase [bacterium 210820-DFI.6.52]|uniref:Undecaprenyl-diphosphatase n=1 Tax=Bittarella massiliensis (ex Durand et al. 2017) TaxID=1720313 RepID=A0AAQ1RWK8_9FIRM|nr:MULTISPECIES: undecaprenyl-diphosphate phosphatase [Eubacteriales]MCB5942067.1 undecaprenyl-diphosphate phosphatase [bacterium 210820-DFI.6.52]ERI97376.1 undecaprenyl-diphosphatase UppP [Clostridium sp. ATCC 29733]MZL70524.1 undecaprenyl-diphosphate phosphatase [Bittarella massiliensis (ex Durand et al. 2017)]MZL80252.1 undecaprenyl-diphosphate phosphatase [Bittarella massiliensis (ex Durand et al. 2017)]SHG35670.1 Undecaprenyl-diphosphatase [Bittarella massiliensis (ex Durand et al. 2017)]
MWDILKAIILGIIEGLTEWLPVSSTGHMILADEFIHMDITPAFKEMFLVVIQLGAILSIVVLFWNKLWPFSFKKGQPHVKKDTFQLWFKVLVASIPALIVGLPFNDQIDALFYNYITVSITLILYGVLFIWMENRNRRYQPRVRNLGQLTYKHAFIMGCFQVLALIPGTSRSGATILGAVLVVGCARPVAAEFSFFMAIPAMAGASLLKLVKFGFSFTGMEVAILAVGSLVAFVVSMLSVGFLMNYVKKHDFKVFGWYRIVLGAVVLAYFLLFAK